MPVERFHGIIMPVEIRDVIKEDFGGKLPSGRPFRPDVRVYPADGFLPSADTIKTASARTRKKNKKIKNKK
jgi:hypothetical protein